jgi:hypothetical protein
MRDDLLQWHLRQSILRDLRVPTLGALSVVSASVSDQGLHLPSRFRGYMPALRLRTQAARCPDCPNRAPEVMTPLTRLLIALGVG